MTIFLLLIDCLFVSFVLCLSIIGAIFIVFGLYTVVWGKSKDPLASSAPLKDEKSNNLELPVTADPNGISGRTWSQDFIFKIPKPN